MKERVLLSGASGFVGKNLKAYLEQENRYEIIALSREDLKILNTDFAKDVSVIIHLAGKAHDLKGVSDPEDYYKINTEITKRIYDTFLISNAKKFIFISSVKASADYVNGVLDEKMKPNPITHYGKSKLLAEEYIENKVLPEGKSFYILRPCMIHGPGNKGNLNLLFNVIKKRIPYPLGAFNNLRSFLSVDNLNFIIHSIITDPLVQSGVYNVADDEPLSTNQIIEIISAVNGKRPRIWRINQKLIKTLAAVGDKLYLPLNSERLKKLTESFVVSNTKIKYALNLKKMPVSSTEGLTNTIKSFYSR